MLKIGASTAPVMLTLLSRPVRAGQCMTGSAFVGSSVGTSHSPHASTCRGATIQGWIAATTWPTPYKKTTINGFNGWDATQFHCATTGFDGTCFSADTMLEVLGLTDDLGLKSVGRYLTAALLNARSGRTPVLSETTVRTMWNSFVTKGYYEPTAGIHWQAPQIIAYIKSTMA